MVAGGFDGVVPRAMGPDGHGGLSEEVRDQYRGKCDVRSPQGAVQRYVYIGRHGRHEDVDTARSRDVEINGVEARFMGVSQGFIGFQDLSPKHRPEEHWHGEV